MKYRRNQRLVDMAQYLLTNPNHIVSLSFFSERYELAKSSVSEDLAMIRDIFLEQNTGRVRTISGAAGGVIFSPCLSFSEQEKIIYSLAESLSDDTRLLPGGYVYLSDLLGNPQILRNVGRLIATKYIDQKVDVVMTVATKGISLAGAVANCLNIPFVIVRRDSKITEGATVSVNYASGSSARIEKMELSKRSLAKGSQVLVVDDFMKGGGTVAGLKTLIEEFDSELVGIVVFAESKFLGEKLISDYDSLLYVKDVDVKTKTIKVVPGNFLENMKKILVNNNNE